MIRIKEITGSKIRWEADTEEEARLFENLINKYNELVEANKNSYNRGYQDGYNQARGECLVKLHRIQDQLLVRGISPIYI